MTLDDFPQYAELWREQIGPEELARIQARAKTIARSAKRKQVVDLALAVLAIAMVCLVLWMNPASWQVKLGFAVLVAGVLWHGWKRHQITRTALATVDDPGVFYATAIKNLRSEISLSTVSLCVGGPVFIASISLSKASEGLNGLDWILRDPLQVNLEKFVVVATIFVIYVYFIRENLQLREQLRRLEDMSRDWTEQQAGAGGDR